MSALVKTLITLVCSVIEHRPSASTCRCNLPSWYTAGAVMLPVSSRSTSLLVDRLLLVTVALQMSGLVVALIVKVMKAMIRLAGLPPRLTIAHLLTTATL